MTTATDTSADVTPEVTEAESAAAKAKAEADALKAETLAKIEADPFASALYAKMTEQVAEYNKGAKTLEANSGDLTPLLSDLRETSDDPEVVKIRESIEALDNKRESLINKANEILKGQITADRLSDDEITALKDSLKTFKSAISKGMEYLKNTADIDLSIVVPALVGTRNTGGSGGGSGSGGRRPRVNLIYVNGDLAAHEVTNAKTQEKVNKSTFTDASKMTGVDVPDLHAAYFTAAKTTDMDAAPDEVEFTVTSGDKHYAIKVIK